MLKINFKKIDVGFFLGNWCKLVALSISEPNWRSGGKQNQDNLESISGKDEPLLHIFCLHKTVLYIQK